MPETADGAPLPSPEDTPSPVSRRTVLLVAAIVLAGILGAVKWRNQRAATSLNELHNREAALVSDLRQLRDQIEAGTASKDEAAKKLEAAQAFLVANPAEDELSASQQAKIRNTAAESWLLVGELPKAGLLLSQVRRLPISKALIHEICQAHLLTAETAASFPYAGELVRQSTLAANTALSMLPQESRQEQETLRILNRLDLIEARLAGHAMVATTARDQDRKQLAVTQMKLKAAELSAKLRQEMAGAQQKNEQELQAAATANDPEKFAVALKQKEAAHAALEQEFQRREQALKDEMTKLLLPDADLIRRQDAWVVSARRASASAQKGTLAEIRCLAEEAAALTARQMKQEALTVAEKALKLAEETLATTPDHALLQRLTAESCLRVAESAFLQSLAAPPDQAPVLLQTAEAKSKRAVELSQKDGPLQIRSQATLAAILSQRGALDDARKAQQITTERFLTENGAAGLSGIYQLAQARIAQKKATLRTNPTPENAKALAEAESLSKNLEDLHSWQISTSLLAQQSRVLQAQQQLVKDLCLASPETSEWSGQVK